MVDILNLGLFIPLIGFIILLCSSFYITRRTASVVACSTICISFVCFLLLLWNDIRGAEFPLSITLFEWIPVRAIQTDFALYVDSLSLLMALIITGIGFLIHVYSIGYMDHEKDFARYFAYLNFFIFSMLLLVLASNLLLLFVGWEGVGVASYLLIGFWYTRPAAAQAAIKAFVLNRIGDLGLLLGIILTFYLFGTSDITQISGRVKTEFSIGAPILTLVTLLYFIGAIGKSAQLPLYTWLPNAMEGPTPVSALIHAATMVTAGIYLLVRMHAVFILAPLTLQIVGTVGAATALFAALCALAQTDLKRVLAYSTISQLGFMFIACGAGAFYTGMFHLTMHAFVKALLFLAAGNVVHMLHGVTEMSKMGGLSQIFSKTKWLFLIGVLALAGLPPLATFFSKDLILEHEYLIGQKTLFYVGLLASILTGFYLMRAFCLAFTGRLQTEYLHIKMAKEAPSIMLVPVAMLAVLSILGGFLGFTFTDAPLLEKFLSQIPLTPVEKELKSGFVLTSETWIAIGGSLFGVLSAALIYIKYPTRLGPTVIFLKKSFYINEIYEALVERPVKAIAHVIVGFFEPKIFDDSLIGLTRMTQKGATALQSMQSGQIRSYIAWIVIGSVVLLFYLVF